MKKLLFLLLATVTLGACKKDAGSSPTSSNTDLLIAKHWQITAYTTDYTTNGPISAVDVYATAMPCYLDNTTTFTSGGVVETDEGATKCDPSAPQKIMTSWTYDVTRNELTAALPISVVLGSSFQPIPFTISGITATYLRITRKRIDLQSVTNETITFKAI